MAWLSSTPDGIVTSVKRAVSKEIQHTTYQYRIITYTSVTTVTEYTCLTKAYADTLAQTAGWNDQTMDAYGFVSASSQADVVRQNDADAYKVVRTQMSNTASAGAWTNNPAP